VRSSCEQHRLFKGFLAGMAGGLIAAWTMNRFQSALSRVEQAWEESAHRPKPQQASSGDEAATAKMARKLAQGLLQRDLTDDEMKIAEPLVHYGYGVLAGGVYGALAEITSLAKSGTGSVYATALWLGGDEIAVPKLGLSKPASSYPAKVHAASLAAHLVYGFTAEEVRRGFRALLR
jgi:hypothetical protein